MSTLFNETVSSTKSNQRITRQQSIWSSSSDGQNADEEANLKEFHDQFKLKDKWYNNIYIVAPCAYGTALLSGTAFYTFNDGTITIIL